jgi:hypothetical protein
MKLLHAVLTASLFVVPALAASLNVRIDYDKSFNFSKVKTYSIRIGTTWGNDIAERQVLAEFDEGIASKGWTKAEQGEAQIEVILHGATEVKHTLNTFYNGMGGYGYGYGYGWGGPGVVTTTMTDYTVGTLVVDMFDTETKHLVFRGTAQHKVSSHAKKNVKRIEKTASEMFEHFPPGTN